MSEAARADWLARAVNGLIRGHRPPEAPAGEDEAELHLLLDAARARLEMSLLAANCAREYQGAVWQELMRRLNTAHGTSEDPREIGDITQICSGIAEEASRLAETRRQAVWQDVSDRIAHKSPEKGLWAFLRRLRRSADEPLPQPLPQAVSPPRSAAPHIAEGAFVTAKERVWARMAANAARHQQIATAPPRLSPDLMLPRRLAIAAAVLALLLAAVGPLPSTGFAGHPAVTLIDAIGRQFVASEHTPPPLTTLPAPEVIHGQAMDAQEASLLMGLPLRKPAAPEGFEEVASRYYGDPAMADAFLIMYQSTTGSLVIHQEAASASPLAAGGASIVEIGLPDGEVAMLIEGAWTPRGSTLEWTSGSDRSLAFERDGIRTIISAHGSEIGSSTLVGVASSMR
jgi:hypothetical protein